MTGELLTARLRVVAATPETVRAEIADRAAFAGLIGAEVPADWPSADLAEALPWFLEQLEAGPHAAGWLNWYGVLRDPAVLVAGAGFFGPPADGLIMVGYGSVPRYRGRGLATELVGALVERALGQPGVERVVADTAPDNAPSLRLLAKCGFAECGDAAEPGLVRYERRRDGPPVG